MFSFFSPFYVLSIPDRYEDYRRCFKAIRESEKTLDKARKYRDDCATRLQKLHRDLDKFNRKSDYGKVSQIESEIIAAEQAHDMAEADFQEKYKETEIIKVAKIKEALSNIANAYTEMAEKTMLVFSATKDLANLIPDEPVHLSANPVFEGKCVHMSWLYIYIFLLTNTYSYTLLKSTERYCQEVVESARTALQEYQPQTPYTTSYSNQQYDDEVNFRMI